MNNASTPSQRRYEKNRKAILDAAREIIVEQGLSALSMRTLAAQVDYSPSALYKYFTDKEEIIEELTQEARQLQQEYNQRHLPAADNAALALIQSGMNIYEFAKQYPVQFQLTTAASKSSPDNLAALMEDPSFKALRLFLAEKSQAGQLNLPKGFTPDLMAFQLWFMIHGASTLRLSMMSKFGPEMDRLMEQVNAALFEMLSVP
jgi:AcrR family transcriptional regulator